MASDDEQRESAGTGEPMVERLASALDVPAELVTEWVSPRSEAEQPLHFLTARPETILADFIHDPDSLMAPGPDPGKPCPPPDSVYAQGQPGEQS